MNTTLNTTRVVQIVSLLLAVVGIVSLVRIMGDATTAEWIAGITVSQSYALLLTIFGATGLLASGKFIPLSVTTWSTITGVLFLVLGIAGVISGSSFSGFSVIDGLSTADSVLNLAVGAVAIAASRNVFDRETASA